MYCLFVAILDADDVAVDFDGSLGWTVLIVLLYRFRYSPTFLPDLNISRVLSPFWLYWIVFPCDNIFLFFLFDLFYE